MLLHIIAAVIVVALVVKIWYKLIMGRCKSPVCLVGKTVLITGGNSGLGFQTALALAGRGCRLIIADKDDCQKSKEKIIQETGNSNIVIKRFDLASLSSVRKLAKDINDTEERLDILINNAGTIGIGNGYTEDGLQKSMQINHFGPFLLTHLLVGLLKKSTPSRIIFVSSLAAFFSELTLNDLNSPINRPAKVYSEFIIYANSKLCNAITARVLSLKLKGTGVTSNSLHPGIVSTPLVRKYSNDFTTLQKYIVSSVTYWLIRLLMKNVEEGAQTAIHLALAKDLEKTTGTYFIDCKPYKTPSPAEDQKFASEIWKASEDYVKLSPEEKL